MCKFYKLDKLFSRRQFLKASLASVTNLGFSNHFANTQQENLTSDLYKDIESSQTTGSFYEHSISAYASELGPINAYVSSGSILRKSVPNQIKKKSCILLHGWNSEAVSMHRLRDALYSLPEATGWDFISLSYESNSKSFKENAKGISKSLIDLNLDLETTILIGYSTGGLIARQMIAEGFPCQALITICTPHEGILPWVTTPDITSMSLHMFSEDLAALNQNNRDINSRHTYYLFGIYSKDFSGIHYDDGIVELDSALGMNVFENVAFRQSIRLDYDFMAGANPHIKGIDPTYLTGFTNLGQQILERF